VSPLELVGGFDEIAKELRAAKPVASGALRERVAALGPVERPPAASRFRLRVRPRRVVLAIASAAFAASLIAAVVTRSSGDGSQRATPVTVVADPRNLPGNPPVPQRRLDHGTAAKAFRADRPVFGAVMLQGSSVPPVAGRLQRYEATLRLRVKDVDALSRVTKQAMDLTRALGGYVGSIDYTTRGGKRGGAALVLRVPIANVGTALTQLSGLGTILQQQASVLDVTKRGQGEARQIAKLERQLETATPSEAALIRERLKTLRAKHARLLRSARLARIELGLTTPTAQAAAKPSRLDRTLDDAGAVLLRELEFLLYALVVAGPLLLLGGAVIAGNRTLRRRSDHRLLERA
jgi:hypothetical protein